ncbi:polycystin family receptor for egg jelly-like [Saccopteryx leptura]|uniref:polycystin family receptor for egg jelly-like n=1 Tax=Saccopteryx leptura TaxID=249018 RepID=UPI00339D23B9
MRLGPVLLLLGLGLGCRCLLPPLAPRGARAMVPVPYLGAPAVAHSSSPTAEIRASAQGKANYIRSVGGALGLGLPDQRACLSLRPRVAPGGGVILRGNRGVCFSRGPTRPPLQQCLHVRVLLRSRRTRRSAPTHVDLHLSAPRGLLSLQWSTPLRHAIGPLEWTFELGQISPQDASSASHVSPRSTGAGDPHPYLGFVAQTKCPTDGPTPVVSEAVNSDSAQAMKSSVTCQLSSKKNCFVTTIKINGKKVGSPVVMTRNMDVSLNVSIQYTCPKAQSIEKHWRIFLMPSPSNSLKDPQPLDIPERQLGQDFTSIHIPKNVLSYGDYTFSFRLILVLEPSESIQCSDSIRVTIARSALKAVLLGNSTMRVNFTGRLVLNGSMSSDPDSNDPLEGLQFFWYCTTNPKNYRGYHIEVISKEVCLPEQADLKWTWASGPELTLSPKALKGNHVYFFRMEIRKGDRRAFSEKRVYVLQGPTPIANIACTENCDPILIISDRFSLFLNCTHCVISRDVYTWSLLSPSGNEMAFDWTQQTSTGRNSDYLSVKAFAFRKFFEDEFWISLDLATWSGVNLVLRYPFIINYPPEIEECKINPTSGISLYTKFVVHCINVMDRNIPLTYKVIVSDLHGFGEISSLKENTLGTIMYMGNEPTSPPSFFPAGVLANHYAMKIFVLVYDSLGAFSQVTLYTTVRAPTDKNSSNTVLQQLYNMTVGQNSALSTLIQEQKYLSAGYLMYIAASILNSMKTDATLQARKASLREHIVNQSFILPISNLVEISQVVTAVAKITQKTSEFTGVARKLATVKLWQASQVLLQQQQKDKHIHSEQIEMVSTGILTALSNILKMTPRYEVDADPFYVIQSLADIVLAGKVPENETTAMRSSSFNMYVRKMEQWTVTSILGNEKHCRNCFHPMIDTNSVLSLPANAPISVMFCEFADDPFPWLNDGESISADVVGFRMTGTTAQGDVLEIMTDIVEVFIGRKQLSSEAFNLIVGPYNEPNQVGESLRETIGAFSFEVDSRAVKELLVHIITDVTVLFNVLVYASSQITPTALVATFLVPHEIPPVPNQSGLFNPACTVKMPHVVCLSSSLLQVIAQQGQSSKCNITVVLRAPHFVLTPSDKLVRISVSTVHCLNMYGIQSDWREDNCVVGEKTSWDRVHCVCKNTRRARRQLNAIRLSHVEHHIRYLTAKVIVVPNPIDLRLETIKKVTQNPVTTITVLFIMFTYIALAFWALHRDEMDQFIGDNVIVLPDNDPYDNICYLVTIFTGSRFGSGTRANVFVQLRGTQSTSDVHCLSHPHFKTFYRGSISTFLLTTKSDLGDIDSIRVWQDNEGSAPSWYLSRIKVENLFSRHIWLFMCRKWLSVNTSLDRTFDVTNPDEPLRRIDFFLIKMSNKLRTSHMWFSVFAGVMAKGFSRLQRLSCCLAMLLSSLMCNIMFFNLNKGKRTESNENRYIRSMIIGLESVVITIPVQVTITALFTYAQRKPQVTLAEVSPQKHSVMAVASGHWEERLEKWHAQETAEAPSKKAKTPSSRQAHELQKASVKATVKGKRQLEQAESEASRTHTQNTNTNNRNVSEIPDVPSAQPSSLEGPPPLAKKPRIVLPRWCVYIAWFLVFATSGVSSFFIIIYGLTYGYDKSVEWLFASFCSFCQSIFLVQPCKIMLLSSIRSHSQKYCKNLSWVSNYSYTEIQLPNVGLHPDEIRKQHQYLVDIRGSRMYQPLTEDEINIFKRKRRIKKKALLFLIYMLTHFLFLALLLGLVTLLHHTDSFAYNQFVRNQFSVDLATVTRLPEVYRWLDDVLVPLFHNDLNPAFLPDSSSRILGLPLMRQVRAKSSEKACPPAKNFVPNSIEGEIHCHPEYGTDPEDTENYTGLWKKVHKRATDKSTEGFTYNPPEKRWVYYSHGLLHTYGSGGYAFYFFPDQHPFNSTLRLKDLQRGKWLDERTWAVILDLTTYNPDAGLFCSISVMFEVSQLGVVNTSLSTHSFLLGEFTREPSTEAYVYVAILVFFLGYSVHEGYVVMQEGASYVTRVFNWLNLALKCTLAALIVLLLRRYLWASSLIQFYSSHPENFIPFHAVSQVDHDVAIVLGFLLFLTILKTLWYSRVFYDVRLAQTAIQTALPGICHMALVLSMYFFLFMASGYLVFGQHEWNYSNLTHAMQTLFSYCVSAFQNTEFSGNRVLGVLFLSAFVLLVTCVWINLFRVVILSSYKELRQPVYEEPSNEVEAMVYLCHKFRTLFGFLSFQSKAQDESGLFEHMLYGQPEKHSRCYLGLKTRNINERKMVYLVV